MKFVEIFRHAKSVIFLNCTEFSEAHIDGNDFTFHMKNKNVYDVKAWEGAYSEFSSFLADQDTQKVFKFLPDPEEEK